MKQLIAILMSLAMSVTMAVAKPKKAPMPHHAFGTFSVDVEPLSPGPAEGILRFSINKKLTGNLEGSTTGEMYSGGDLKTGSAGYVAIEVFSGSLVGPSLYE